jgi:16S rRNA (guanine1516-N2)-methyltransferase
MSDAPPLLGVYFSESLTSTAEQLRQQFIDAYDLGLPELPTSPNLLASGHFVLVYDVDGLTLHFTGTKAPGPIKVDFVSGAAAHRRQYGGGKGQMIAKAVGIKGGFRPNILDLTAGLGQDGFVLATLGCALTMVERVPIIYGLLDDGLRRARVAGDSSLSAIVQRIHLYRQEALAYLAQLSSPVDVIYLDPMFPERDKSALVKKSMLAFQHVVGADEDAGELLAIALLKARYRVVVKRPRKAPSIDQQYPILDLPAPGLVLAGKSSRYDIYPLAKMPA